MKNDGFTVVVHKKKVKTIKPKPDLGQMKPCYLCSKRFAVDSLHKASISVKQKVLVCSICYRNEACICGYLDGGLCGHCRSYYN